MSGTHSRTKGAQFERFVARLLRVSFPDARRGLQYTGGREADVEGSPFRIECKRQKTVTTGDVKRAIEQGETDAHEWKDDRPVVAVTRADRGQALVTMKLSTAATIIERFFWREPDNVLPFKRKEEDE